MDFDVDIPNDAILLRVTRGLGVTRDGWRVSPWIFKGSKEPLGVIAVTIRIPSPGEKMFDKIHKMYKICHDDSRAKNH